MPAPHVAFERHLVVGPGALGRLLAIRLALSDRAPKVALLGRRPPPRHLQLVTPEGERLMGDLPGLTAETLATESGRLVHLTTKAYAAQAAFEAIAPNLTPDTPVVLWQNGYGIQETLTRQWSGPVLCASTTEGAYVTGVDEVVHAGHGQSVLGDLGGEHGELASALAETLSRAGLPCQAVDDIRVRLWHKLAVNAAINPLVARFRIRNGQLRDRPFRPMVERVVAEVARIMSLEDIPTPPEGWSGRVWQVVEGTANNRASMLQDVLAGRPTEREAILGPLLAAATRHTLACPALESLHRSSPGPAPE
ncbi:MULTISPECIES: ketopantoate reductase family protein [Halomonadaceae]|uniref:ketopantoate reductase family protein n=1 Tax=Halomonadaceae TaxID=28256 RepID=UPI00159B6E88|nr:MULTISPECIES: ketopantoate reductase family protein [Halomonas]QJQ94707.1 ketopantoate reductase family protein [Halomonas sp. PA5]